MIDLTEYVTMSTAASAKTAGDISTWHAMPSDEVLKRLATSVENGLDTAEASARLQKFGPNRLPEGKKRGLFARFLSQFNNILVYVLLGAGFTKLMLNLWVDAAIIFGVIILNALLGFVQEGKAEKALDSIRNMLSAEARTVREGEARMITAEQLVPGDVVLLEFGRQGACRPPPRGRQKSADRRSGLDRRVDTGGKEQRRGIRKRDDRGS